jgi:hypothetical protein
MALMTGISQMTKVERRCGLFSPGSLLLAVRLVDNVQDRIALLTSFYGNVGAKFPVSPANFPFNPAARLRGRECSDATPPIQLARLMPPEQR